MRFNFKYAFTALFLLVWGAEIHAQKFEFIGKKTSQTIGFKLINNLIIIPLEVNGSALSFILDSGVSAPVVFNLTASDSVQFNNVEKIQIRGLGTGNPLEALHSKKNRFKIGAMYAVEKDMYIIYKDKFDLSAKLGVTVHGMIGYDVFKDHIVTINYSSKKITFEEPTSYTYKNCSKCETFDLEFYKNKPYINAYVVDLNSDEEKPVKLLIDSGGSDAIWLFEDQTLATPDNSFQDFLGEGISGSIYGKRSKLQRFKLKSFSFEQPNVAYLDSVSSFHAKKFKDRSGSMGGEILKRFKVVFDYPNSKLTLKKNSSFKNRFTYNMSGIELAYSGEELVRQRRNNRASFLVNNDQESTSTNTVVLSYSYDYEFKPIYRISQVRVNSPAEEAGIKVGDIVVKVNGKYAYEFDLHEIIERFQRREGSLVKIEVNRNGEPLEFQFKLKNILQ